MKKPIIVLFLLIALGINSVSISIAQVANPQKSSEALISAVVDSFNNDNYAKMAVNFGEVMFKEFSQVKFESLRKEVFPLYGKIKSVKYLDSINQLDYTVVLYKATTEKSEMLIKVAIADESGRTAIIGLWLT